MQFFGCRPVLSMLQSTIQLRYSRKQNSIADSIYIQTRCLRPYSDGLRAGRLEFDSRQVQEVFLYSTASTQPPVKMKHG
jgi:hypothetical protein